MKIFCVIYTFIKLKFKKYLKLEPTSSAQPNILTPPRIIVFIISHFQSIIYFFGGVCGEWLCFVADLGLLEGAASLAILQITSRTAHLRLVNFADANQIIVQILTNLILQLNHLLQAWRLTWWFVNHFRRRVCLPTSRLVSSSLCWLRQPFRRAKGANVSRLVLKAICFGFASEGWVACHYATPYEILIVIILGNSASVFATSLVRWHPPGQSTFLIIWKISLIECASGYSPCRLLHHLRRDRTRPGRSRQQSRYWQHGGGGPSRLLHDSKPLDIPSKNVFLYDNIVTFDLDLAYGGRNQVTFSLFKWLFLSQIGLRTFIHGLLYQLFDFFEFYRCFR